VTAADQPDARDEDVAAAVSVLAAGGVVAYPTETVYGLGVDARDRAALEMLLDLKGREGGRGISVLVSGLDMAAELLAETPCAAARELAARFWPGPLTIVLPASGIVAEALRGPAGGIGLRCSSDPWATALVTRFGAPVTSTSANASGHEPARSAAEVRAAFASGRDAVFTSHPSADFASHLRSPAAVTAASASLFVLDGGPRRGNDVSTVVEFSKERATLRRRGAISAESIATVVDLAEDPRG